MSSEKFTILMSWSPICIPLIILWALMKLASTSATIMYIMENRHPWQTLHVKLKGTDRRPFILILDWILVYGSSTI